MKQILRSIWWSLFFILVIVWLGAMTWTTHYVITDDPPKPKKEIKEDTTQIDLKQMQEINVATNKRSLLLDSLIMKIDTLKKKR